jgi:hypothetical protein
MGMFKQFMSVALIGLMVFSTSTAAFAQSSVSSQQTKTEKIKAKIRKLGLGERVKVSVKLVNDSSYKGYVSQAGEDDFTVIDKTGQSNIIKYSEVKSVSGKNLSTGAKIGIGIAIGAGAVLAVLGILIASLDD